jgi:hypothetical protein
VRPACARSARATGAARFVVQERVAPGVELLLGARRDEVFGPVVVVRRRRHPDRGAARVSVRLAPVGEEEAAAMLDEGVRRAAGRARGLRPVDRAPLVAASSGRRPRGRAAHRRDRRHPDRSGRLVAVDALVSCGACGRSTRLRPLRRDR